jgi:hypothetical protein
MRHFPVPFGGDMAILVMLVQNLQLDSGELWIDFKGTNIFRTWEWFLCLHLKTWIYLSFVIIEVRSSEYWFLMELCQRTVKQYRSADGVEIM